MNKFVILLVVAAVLALVMGSVGIAYAQSPTQSYGSGAGWMGGNSSRAGMGVVNWTGSEGILHDYMLADYAIELDIPLADLEARLDNGETMSQIALSAGLTVEQFRTLMIKVRSEAINQALSDGVLTQAQADWFKQHGAGQMAGNQMGNGRRVGGNGMRQFANPDCPYYSPTNP